MPPVYDRDQLKLVIEGILFVAEGPVELRTLARLVEGTADDVARVIDELASESKSRGVRIQRVGQSVQLVSAPEITPFVQAFLGIDEHQRLSPSMLATLTVIAYKQPVTRGAVERILRKDCDYGITMLRARGLIAEVGRAEGPGRPYLYGTTFKFLEHFGLEKPEDLPPLPEIAIAEAAADAAAEAEAEALGEEAGSDAQPDEPERDPTPYDPPSED